MTRVPLLPSRPVGFPNPQRALEEPDGLLAAGGGLDPGWLIEAYACGIFPWFNSDDEHILWWSPSTRAVLLPGAMHTPRSLRKRIRNAGFRVVLDEAFLNVVRGCSGPRQGTDGTWITPRMMQAYHDLFQRGYAHSVEVYLDQSLVGGLYGVSLGGAFFGESMFSRVSDASKVALYWLQRQLQAWGFLLIDCQLMNPHLATLGVGEINRTQFLEILQTTNKLPTRQGRWRFDEGLINLD